MYILRAIQIQDFRDFIFVNLLLLYLVLQVYYNYFIKVWGFKFRGLLITHENSEINVPRKFVQVW